MLEKNQNPYMQASNAYGSVLAETSQRALEARALQNAAMKIEHAATRMKNGEQLPLDEIEDVLTFNQKLWTLFVSDATTDESPLPQDIKNNIASLALFIFKRSQDLLTNTAPERMQVLVDINRNIAAGLMAQMSNSVPAGEAKPATPAKATDDLI